MKKIIATLALLTLPYTAIFAEEHENRKKTCEIMQYQINKSKAKGTPYDLAKAIFLENEMKDICGEHYISSKDKN